MAPGEPIASNSEEGDDQYVGKTSKYKPSFNNTDRYVQPLLNFDPDTSTMEEVHSAASYWADIAKELKEKNYPLFEGINNSKQFDSDIRKKGRMLDDFLDMLVTKKLFNDDKGFNVLRVLIAQGNPYLEFKEKMSSVNFSLKCNSIWENDAVAYRCNTCALTPCMALCEACFDANGHEGHNYTRFFSREGGACDCGNQDVIKEQGNCSKHGDESKRPKYDMEDVVLAEHIVMKLLVLLFLIYRGWQDRFTRAESAHRNTDDPIPFEVRPPAFDLGSFTEADAARANLIIDFLQECSNYGGPMRLIVAEVLMNKGLYQALTEKTSEHYDSSDSGRVELSLDWRTSHAFIADRESLLITGSSTDSFSFMNSMADTDCLSLLDELIFWINRQLFPQNLVNFGLSMLSEPGYRDEFAFRFFAWYPMCGKVINDLCKSQADHARGDDKVSPACSRAVHVTVQMLSSASLCRELNDKVQLVKVIFEMTQYLICNQLQNSLISLESFQLFVQSHKDYLDTIRRRGLAPSKWLVMQMRHNAAISQHGYWFVMGDIQNVLTHTCLAVDVVLDDEAFGGSYMRMMSMMQGMNPIWRIVRGNAQEVDAGEEVQRAYTLEFETLAVTLFNIVAAVQQENSCEGAKKFLDHVLKRAEDWLETLQPQKHLWKLTKRAQAYVVSFHIPLHRHISTALTHFTELDGFYDHVKSVLLRDEILVRLLLIHPLRIQVARAEINCNMWVRNGAQARMSSLIYSQWNVSSAFQTPDIDLIRFCAAHVDKEFFVRALSVNFNLNEMLRIRVATFVKNLPAARKFFQGCGQGAEETEAPEEQTQSFLELRKLIRERTIMIEDIMINQRGRIIDGCGYDFNRREEVMELVLDKRNVTRMLVDFSFKANFNPDRPAAAEYDPAFFPENNSEAEDDEELSDVEEESEEEEEEEEPERRPSPPPPQQQPVDPNEIANPPEPTAAPIRPPARDGEREAILQQHEWIDPMFWGMFKLVAELIVVRVNSGATSEDHYRSEMVNCMAMGNVPYSRLRGSISEKGSRGSELIDKHFERILSEIGDFIEPNEGPNSLQQGSYQLKTSVWDSELCPVFFMMRSTSMKQAREVFAKMEARERKNATEKGLPDDGVQVEPTFWVPFRLVNFSESRRHPGIAQIYRMLLSERWILHCIAVLASGSDCEARFHDVTIQLALYMLTLGVKYALEFQGDDEVKSYLLDIYHTPFRMQAGRNDSFHTVCSFMVTLLEKEARKKESLIPLFKNILDGKYDQEKVTGGRMIYLARFITILAKLSPTCRRLINRKMGAEEYLQNKALEEEESKKQSSVDPAKQAVKEAAKRRMAAIMQKSALKSAQTMEKLMKSEGMTADEVEKVDPSQQNRQLFQCPICGEIDVPNTVEQPFGMLAKLSTNFVCDEQIDANCEVVGNVLELDRIDRSDGPLRQMRTRREFSEKRRMAEHPLPEVSKVRAPVCGTDLKTCGHAAHIICFNAYRLSLYDGHQRPDRREVGCPLCRFTINTIVPISVDKPYSPLKTSYSSPQSFTDTYRAINEMLVKSKGPVFEEKEKNVRYQTMYSTRDGGGLCEVWRGRQNSADFSERRSSMERCTVSTVMAALAVAMVERSSFLRRFGVPERRKNGRSSLTEHIMSAAVATSKDVDFEVILAANTGLFVKVEKRAEPSERPPERPSSSVPFEQFDYTKDKEVQALLSGLATDELTVLNTTKSRKRPMILADVVPRMELPMFVLDAKSTLVRMIALVVDSQSVTKDVQREMAHNLISASCGWVSAYTAVCLVLRLGEQKMQALSSGALRIDTLSESQLDLLRSVAKPITANVDFLKFLCNNLRQPEDCDHPRSQPFGCPIQLTDEQIRTTLDNVVVEFLRFSAELLLHCGLGSVETVERIHQPGISVEDTLRIMEIDSAFLNPPEKAEYWSLMYKNTLAWRAKLNKYYQPCITEPLTWKHRRILRPSRSFEELFTRFFHRECINCTTSPSNPVICLMCGQLLCLDDCCRITHQEVGTERTLSMSEIEVHAERCSSSSGLYISITSSMIIVMRGKQAAIWGTVYLDSHKEEDRNLKRGKPLFLCESRFKWLEYDWAEQEWQRVYQWFNLNNSHSFINHIRDCHLLHH